MESSLPRGSRYLPTGSSRIPWRPSLNPCSLTAPDGRWTPSSALWARQWQRQAHERASITWTTIFPWLLRARRISKALEHLRWFRPSVLRHPLDSSTPGPRAKPKKTFGTLGVPSLTILRPIIIDGERGEFRRGESIVLQLSKALAPILPRGFRANPASTIARVLIDAVVDPKPGTQVVLSQELTART